MAEKKAATKKAAPKEAKSRVAVSELNLRKTASRLLASTLVSTRYLDHFIEFDDATGALTCEAGGRALPDHDVGFGTCSAKAVAMSMRRMNATSSNCCA